MALFSRKKKPTTKRKTTKRRKKATPAQLRALAKGRKIRAANLKKAKRKKR